jgi:hypothetical protein
MSATEAQGTALITHASSCMDAIYADHPARRGDGLVVIAGSQGRFAALVRRFKNERGRSVETIAAHLNEAARRSIWKAMALIACLMLAATEAAMANSTVTRRTLEIEHVRINSTKTFAEVEAALSAELPQLDPAISAALANGNEQRARELEGGSKLFIFLKRDHGALLQITGRPGKALQYEIGNPLTATRMTRHQLPAALYAPLRVVLYENAAGSATFEYDRPSKLFGQFGDERVTAVGRELDAALEGALRRAAE